ncbi:MAG TPA: Fe-S cluster assembly protein SufD [Bacteroidota bacterium]|nr:Fe-S cluster assembly protein SufD [Bacteroidota bacterium]
MKETTEVQHWYKGKFDLFEKGLNGEASAEIHSIRRAAIAKFAELGFPTTKNEEWRFTNVAPISDRKFTPSLEKDHGIGNDAIHPFLFKTPHRLVFVNGLYSETLSCVGSLPRGVVVGSLSTALRSNPGLVARYFAKYVSFDDNAFVALNTAFVRDGAFVHVPDGVRFDDPILLLFVSDSPDGVMMSPRNLLMVGKKSQLSIVESFVTLHESAYLVNAVTEVSLDEESVLEHDKLQNDGMHAFHVSATHVHQKGRSNYTSNTLTMGGAIVRNNLTTVLDGEYSECTLNGLSLGTGSQLIDHHTSIDHAKPNCPSHELYKAILDGKSHGVFNGKIFVRQDAQKTDAKQTNKTLLLSDEAVIDTKPQLEIFADDVKCTHGATVGQIDDEQVFYLRSRGIDRTMARDILTFAFAGDVVSRVHNEALRNQLESLVHRKLDEGRRGS